MALLLRVLSLLAESICPRAHVIPLQPANFTYWPEEDE